MYWTKWLKMWQHKVSENDWIFDWFALINDVTVSSLFYKPYMQQQCLYIDAVVLFAVA